MGISGKKRQGRAVKTALFFCALFVHDNPVTAWRKPSIFAAWQGRSVYAAWRIQCLRRLARTQCLRRLVGPVFIPLGEPSVYLACVGSGFVSTFGVQADATVPFVQAGEDSGPV